MIAQLKKGCGFAGLTAYCNKLGSDKARIIEHQGVCMVSSKAMAASLLAQAKMNERVKQFVGHAMLSFSPKDEPKLTDEFVLRVAHEYMERMGIKNTQYIIYRHYDQPHGHVHIAYNRVDNDGNAIKTDTNFRASALATQAITRKFKLTFGKGKDGVRRERLRGRDKAKYHLYDTIKEALRHVHGWEALRAWLMKKGVDMNVKTYPDGHKGVSFSDGKTSFAGSKIDRSLGYYSIDKMFREYAKRSGASLGVQKAQATAGDRTEKERLDDYHSYWNGGLSGYRDGNGTSYESGRSVSNAGKESDNKYNINEALERSEGSSDSGSTANEGIGEGIGGGIAAAAAEVILQPHVVPTMGGGGGGDTGSRKKRDDEEDDEERRPRRKGRR